ncbi:MAG: hypothetical protein U0871_03970 [Gemmataceae bacterium]
MGPAAGGVRGAARRRRGEGPGRGRVGPAGGGRVPEDPEAVALWGTSAGGCWSSGRTGTPAGTWPSSALYRFAADLRDRLAGPNPSALEVLLAERVVIGWVFVNYCESAYLGALDKLTWDVSKCHTQRLELAHRTLMAACGTLAKVAGQAAGPPGPG